MTKMMRWLALSALLLIGMAPQPSAAAPFAGFSPCTTTPASLSASTTSSNVALSTCGPTVIVWNITSTEIFFKLGAASSTAATTSDNSLPGNSYIVLNVGDAGLYLAVITASSTSTVRLVQGRAEQ